MTCKRIKYDQSGSCHALEARHTRFTIPLRLALQRTIVWDRILTLNVAVDENFHRWGPTCRGGCSCHQDILFAIMFMNLSDQTGLMLCSSCRSLLADFATTALQQSLTDLDPSTLEQSCRQVGDQAPSWKVRAKFLKRSALAQQMYVHTHGVYVRTVHVKISPTLARAERDSPWPIAIGQPHHFKINVVVV